VIDPSASEIRPATGEDDAPCAHVVWHSSLLDRSGYAQVARLLVFALDDAGTKIRPAPIWGSMAEVAT
jgi:hypothetical protein